LSGGGCVIVNGRCKLAAINSPTVKSAIAAKETLAVPAPTKSNKIGTRIMALVDSTRDDPFLNDGRKRELLVRFWYPATLDGGCRPAEYTSPRVWSHFAQLTGLPLPKVTTNSCLNAAVTDNAHPIVVFTHGYTGTFTDYTFLFEDLASRGYVVVSIDHTYEATAVEFPNGQLAKSLVGSHLNDTWRTDDKTVSFVLSVRAKDLTFIVNELERLNTTAGNPFSGKLDTSRIALMGHSLGGQATLTGLKQEARFKAGVILDGALNDKSVEGSEKPVLILAAGRDQWTTAECKLWDSLTGPRLAVNLSGAEHLTPSDAVWLAKGVIKTGDMGPEKTMAAVRNYIAAFLETNLEGEPPDPLLSGPTTNYRDASITPREQSLCDGTQVGR
jgi:dienelactone hydrolase